MIAAAPRRRAARQHRPPGSGAALGAQADVEDVLIFEQRGEHLELIGGSGRGASWAGIVTLEVDDPSLVARAWRRGVTERVAGRTARQVAGPYYARHAAAVPAGHGHVVLLGGSRPIASRDSELLRFAIAAVDQTQGVPAHKLLADELELVDTLRALMAYRPVTVRDTIRHVATVAARALSCELALIRIECDGKPVLEGIDLRSPGASASGADGDHYLATASRASGPSVEQAASARPDVFGVEVAARLTLPLRLGSTTGALVLGHAASAPRGFTSLCQRIARAVADTAELLISQAQAREQLAAERDLLARLSGTDALTGIPNRRAWQDLATLMRHNAPGDGGFVVSADLDGLKAVNDRFGHAAGDALIRGAANLLTSSLRDTDLVARIGGDEFAALIRGVDADAAQRLVARLRRAERAWRVTEYGLRVRLSLGHAPVVNGDIEGARAVADRRMYSNKRRRARAQPRLPAKTPTERRTSG